MTGSLAIGAALNGIKVAVGVHLWDVVNFNIYIGAGSCSPEFRLDRRTTECPY